MKQRIGSLMYLYLEEIEPVNPTEIHDFLISGAAKAINKADNRNWIPIIVKQIGADHYQVIGNSFIYAVAEEAGLEKVWCIIADESEITEEVTQLLAQEQIPKIDLATASLDEIKLGLDYLMKRSFNPLKGVKLATASHKIFEAPRQYWNKNLTDVTKLKCGITQGAKLNIFKEIFYVTPQPLPELITDPKILDIFTQAELKNMAKKRGLKGYSKLKKTDLIKLLSQE